MTLEIYHATSFFKTRLHFMTARRHLDLALKWETGAAAPTKWPTNARYSWRGREREREGERERERERVW